MGWVDGRGTLRAALANLVHQLLHSLDVLHRVLYPSEERPQLSRPPVDELECEDYIKVRREEKVQSLMAPSQLSFPPKIGMDERLLEAGARREARVQEHEDEAGQAAVGTVSCSSVTSATGFDPSSPLSFENQSLKGPLATLQMRGSVTVR